MKTVLAALALLSIAAAPMGIATSASAAPTLIHNDGMTAAELAKWLKDKGEKADVSKDDQGDPLVQSSLSGLNYDIYFYDCNGKPRCRAVQFSVGFDLKTPLTASKINEWNRNNRYLKAYIDDEGDPHLQYDVNVNAGRTMEGFADDFDIWEAMLGDFTDFIGW